MEHQNLRVIFSKDISRVLVRRVAKHINLHFGAPNLIWGTTLVTRDSLGDSIDSECVIVQSN